LGLLDTVEAFYTARLGHAIRFQRGHLPFQRLGLIERFSEDIDIVVNRSFLGFGGDVSPEKAQSQKQRKKRLEKLKETCRLRIHPELKPALEQSIMESLAPEMQWSLTVASPDEDPDEQTLLFEYPGTLAGSLTYLRPQVKIELGARSDTWPTESPLIKPYLADAFPDMFSLAGFPVQAISPERTFWEKACCSSKKIAGWMQSRENRVFRVIITTSGVLLRKESVTAPSEIRTCLTPSQNIAPFSSNRTGWTTTP